MTLKGIFQQLCETIEIVSRKISFINSCQSIWLRISKGREFLQDKKLVPLKLYIIQSRKSQHIGYIAKDGHLVYNFTEKKFHLKTLKRGLLVLMMLGTFFPQLFPWFSSEWSCTEVFDNNDYYFVNYSHGRGIRAWFNNSHWA